MERKPEDIVKDIDATRDELINNIDEIAERLQPEEIAKRTFAKAEATAKKTAAQVKSYYVDEVSGEIRQDRAMKTGAIAFGLLVLRKLLK
jgi:DNA-binding ferritin-like protein